VFLVNSRLSLFTATLSCSNRKIFTLLGHLFSRSYEASLPSSLTRVIPRALVFSTHLPVSVLVRILNFLTRGFSSQRGINHFPASRSYSLLEVNRETDLPISHLYQLKPQSNKRLIYPPASPHR
jgi:hypothetical protein